MVRMVLRVALALAVAGLSACGGRTVLPGAGGSSGESTSGTTGSVGSGGATSTGSSSTTQGSTGSTTGGVVPPQRPLDKLDILLAVDNSISMADKQQLLVAAIPELIGRLANPYCVDARRQPYRELTPPAGQACPPGPAGEELVREFLPVLDLHVGLVTSALARVGAHSCTVRASSEAAGDFAHLFGSLPRGANVSGMNAWGFLEWGPETDQRVFEQQVEEMVAAVQENGCGWESSLETWFRFLVDPAPHADVQVSPCSDGSGLECLTKTGVDEVILQQRKAFLRPDSVVIVIVLSDENDCSAIVDSRTWQLFSTINKGMDHGTSTCAVDPNDQCCHSCGVAPPEGCAPDPSCGTPEPDQHWDEKNLRCFEQKRRFGVDVLQPLRRYAAALTEEFICPDELDLGAGRSCDNPVPNPLFSDLETGEPIARTPGAAFLTTIVGVPWQDLAADTDIAGGPLPPNTLRYKPPEELEADGTWDLLIGSTLNPPGDPLMLESILPRAGTHPITGDPVAPPSAGPFANSINGHERDVEDSNDLQYSCIFPFPEVRDCALRDPPCDCTDPYQGFSPNTPLCQDPQTGEYSTIQHSGKAYPPQRHVRLVRTLGQQGVLSSICARNTQDPALPDYAYRPAVAALVERIAPVLRQPE